MIAGRALVVLAIYALAGACLGVPLRRLVLGRAESEPEDDIPSLATAFLLGQAALAVVWQTAALLGWLSPAVVLSVLAVVVLAGLGPSRASLASAGRHLGRIAAGLAQQPLGLQIIAALIVLLTLSSAIGCALPLDPRGDAVAYYLTLPKVVASAHRLAPLPGYEGFMQVGLVGEMHSAALMSLAGATTAKTFIWLVGLAGAVMLIAIAHRVGLGAWGQWIAAAMLITSSDFMGHLSSGKVDLFGAALGLAAIESALSADAGRQAGALRLTGLLTGLAIVAKISYAAVLPVGIVFLLFCDGVRRPEARRWRGIAAVLLTIGLWAAVALVPNAIKNAVLYGQPLAPFIGSTVTGINNWFQPKTALRITLTYPFALVFGQFWAQEGNLSPLFLALGPLVFLRTRTRFLEDKLLQVTVAGLLGVACWLVYRPTIFAPRYIMTPLLLLLPIGASAAEGILRSPRAGRSVLGVTVYGAVAFCLWMHLGLAGAWYALQLATGRSSAFHGPMQRLADEINPVVGPHERVFFGAYYRFWFDARLLQCAPSSEESQAVRQLSSPSEQWRYLVDRGFRYLVVDRQTHAQVLADLDLKSAPAWLKLTSLVQGKLVAYRFEAKDAAEPQCTCESSRPPSWQVVERPASTRSAGR